MSSDTYSALASCLINGRGSAPPWVCGEIHRMIPFEVMYGGVVLGGSDLTVNAAVLNDTSIHVGDTVVLLPDAKGQHFFVAAKGVVLDD